MKVLWYSDWLIPTGLGKGSYYLVKGLIQRGFKVAVATPYMGGPPRAVDGVLVYPMMQFDPILLGRTVVDFDPDIAVTYMPPWIPPNNQLSSLYRELGVKHMWIVPVEYDEVSVDFVAPLVGSNYIVTLTQAGKKALDEFLPEDCTTVIPYGVDHSIYYRENPKPKFREFRRQFIYGYVGRNMYRKDIPAMLEAFARLPLDIRDKAGFYMHTARRSTAGEVVYWPLDWLTVKYNLQGKIFYPDFVTMWQGVDEDMLRRLYCAMDCYVHASFGEGFGLPLVEAMCCGVPVVASANTSIPEVVGDAGILVECHEDPLYTREGFVYHRVKVDKLAEAMEEVYRDEELRQRLIKRGLEKAQEFNWEKASEAVAQAIEQARKHYRIQPSHIKQRMPV